MFVNEPYLDVCVGFDW